MGIVLVDSEIGIALLLGFGGNLQFKTFDKLVKQFIFVLHFLYLLLQILNLFVIFPNFIILLQLFA
jgi:hypothetical protein